MLNGCIQSKPFYVLYTGDKLGYRSRDSYAKKPIVLTIEGQQQIIDTYLMVIHGKTN